jgi:hypothetical protein
MPDAPALRVYPQLWQQSLQQHPTSWQDQFRCLCALASNYRKTNRADYRRLPEGEKLFLQSLAECDVEDLVHTIATEWGRDLAHPLLPFDPSPPDVDKSEDPDIYPVQMNGKRYGHA